MFQLSCYILYNHKNKIVNILCHVLISVLEFELRKAHDTIKALRGSLTEATGKSHEFQF